MDTHYSAPADWVGQENLGFVINAAFTETSTALIETWLDGLREVAPEGLYAMPADSLHITVLDWVAPLFDYAGQDKRALFERLRPDYDAAMSDIIGNMDAFDVHFDTVKVTPGTIILTGKDDGQFASLRQQFTSRVQLPEGAKEPPSIIHSSLARFVPPAIDLAPIEEYVASHPLAFTDPIGDFRLVETRREPMQDFTVLKSYNLRNS